MQGRRVEPGSGQQAFIEAFQRAAGVTVDGTRSYDEMTVVWLVWYLGIVAVLLGVVGAALLVARALVGRLPEPLVVLVTLGLPALLYLVRPSITPDQVWAMRRLLPAALPLVLMCAGWLLHVGWLGARGRAVRVGVWAGAGAMLVGPVLAWGPVVATVDFSGRLGQVQALCQRVGSSRVVVVRGQDPPLLPTLRIMCDADVVEVPAPGDAEVLRRIRQAWGGGEVHIVGYTSDAPPWPGAGTPALVTPLARWPHGLEPPVSPIRFEGRTWVGRIAPDGTVTGDP
jgi:hypothetical protein